jgi:hypothetical protein
MITSKQILSYLEDYSTIGKVRGIAFAIYENPTKADFLSLQKEAKDQNKKVENIRYIANAKTKTIYVFNAEFAIHKEAKDILGLPIDPLLAPHILNGEAKLRSSQMIPESDRSTTISKILSNYLNFPDKKVENAKYLKEVFTYNWDWLYSYIKVKPEIEKCKKAFTYLSRSGQ